MMKKSKNIGRRFHGLVVLDYKNEEDQKPVYVCQCDCGDVVEIYCGSIYRTHSCGCSSGIGQVTTSRRGVQPLPSLGEQSDLIQLALQSLYKIAPHYLKTSVVMEMQKAEGSNSNAK